MVAHKMQKMLYTDWYVRLASSIAVKGGHVDYCIFKCTNQG